MHPNDDAPPSTAAASVLPAWAGALVMAGLALLALGLNFDRLFIQLATHLPGQTLTDSADALWHLWWAGFGLAQSDGLVINAWAGAPFLTNHLANLPIIQAQLYRPLNALSSPVLAFNLILILSQVATHLALFFFFRAHSRSTILSALASTAFVLSPWYVDALSRADLLAVGLWPLPLALLAWDAWLESPAPGRAALLVAILIAAVLSGTLHLAWIIALFLPYALWTGLPRRERLRADESARDQLAIMALVFMITLLIFPLPAAVRSLLGAEPPFGPSQPQTPPEFTSFIGPVLDSGPLIWLAGAVSLAFVREFRRYALWVLCAGLFLSYGVHLIPEPWRMFTGAFAMPYQPFYPDEIYMGLALIALLTFMVSHWRPSASGRPVWQIGAAAGSLLLAVLATSPATFRRLPTQAVSPSPVYAEIASEPEDYLVLLYPFGLNSRFDQNTMGQGADLTLYAPWHQKRMLSGIGPYYEPLLFERFSDMPFLSPDDDVPDEADVEALTEAVNTWRIGYVLVYTDRVAAEDLDSIEALLSATDSLCPAQRRDALLLYRARWHPDGCS